MAIGESRKMDKNKCWNGNRNNAKGWKEVQEIWLDEIWKMCEVSEWLLVKKIIIHMSMVESNKLKTTVWN